MDWLGIVIAAILNMVIGFFWYSKWLFGPVWLKLCDMKERELKMKKNARPLVYAFIVSLVIAFFLAFFEMHLGITNVSDGMYLGFDGVLVILSQKRYRCDDCRSSLGIDRIAGQCDRLRQFDLFSQKNIGFGMVLG